MAEAAVERDARHLTAPQVSVNEFYLGDSDFVVQTALFTHARR